MPPNDVKALASGRKLVVGVDGSSGSLAALRWAGREAISCGLDALAVIAWQYPVVSRAGHGVPRGRHPGVVAEEVLVSTLAEAGIDVSRTLVTSAVIEGHPAAVLMQLAKHAELLVIGARGHGSICGALLGSISQYVAVGAACPVIVVTPAHRGQTHDTVFRLPPCSVTTPAPVG